MALRASETGNDTESDRPTFRGTSILDLRDMQLFECLAQRRGGFNISAAVAAQSNEQGKEEMNVPGASQAVYLHPNSIQANLKGNLGELLLAEKVISPPNRDRLVIPMVYNLNFLVCIASVQPGGGCPGKFLSDIDLIVRVLGRMVSSFPSVIRLALTAHGCTPARIVLEIHTTMGIHFSWNCLDWQQDDFRDWSRMLRNNELTRYLNRVGIRDSAFS